MKRKHKEYAFVNSHGEQVWLSGDATLADLVKLKIRVELVPPGQRRTPTRFLHDPTKEDQVREGE
jgi:hypothetical protein